MAKKGWEEAQQLRLGMLQMERQVLLTERQEG